MLTLVLFFKGNLDPNSEAGIIATESSSNPQDFSNPEINSIAEEVEIEALEMGVEMDMNIPVLYDLPNMTGVRVLPIEILPLPQAPNRSSTTRKGLRSEIMTSSPMRKELEEKENTAPKRKKEVQKATKKMKVKAAVTESTTSRATRTRKKKILHTSGIPKHFFSSSRCCQKVDKYFK